jgi:hypothetical protein
MWLGNGACLNRPAGSIADLGRYRGTTNPPKGGNIQPEGDTPIHMAAEKVIFIVRLATESDNELVKLNPDACGLQIQPVWFTAIAEVEADFRIKNPTTEAVSMTCFAVEGTVLKA